MTQQATLTACDITKSKELLTIIKETGNSIVEKVRSLKSQIVNGELDTNSGISFLDAKNQLLGQYNLDIANLVSQKASGKSICDNEVVDRLIQMRTYIEKTRPIEHKLKYQMEKLIKIAAAGGLSKDDPLHLKPNPGNMVSKLAAKTEDSSDDDSEGEDRQSAVVKKETGVYKPPMMSAAHYEEEVTRKEKEELIIAKAKRRALSTAMMRELRSEYSEAPEEVRDDMNLHRFKESKEHKDRINYEEDNFKRIMLTKDEKRKQSQMQTIGTLDTLARFGDYSALTGGAENFGKKRKSKPSKPKSGGKKKRKVRM